MTLTEICPVRLLVCPALAFALKELFPPKEASVVYLPPNFTVLPPSISPSSPVDELFWVLVDADLLAEVDSSSVTEMRSPTLWALMSE